MQWTVTNRTTESGHAAQNRAAASSASLAPLAGRGLGEGSVLLRTSINAVRFEVHFGSAAQQRHELRRRCNIRGECGTALGLFGICAPGLDLKALVELRGDEGGGGIEMPPEQCQGDDQRAAGGGRGMEGGEREIVMRGDDPGKGYE